MITLGLIIKSNTNYEYVINMIAAQVYEAIEIVCSLDEEYDILEFINMHARENMCRVHMIRKRSKSYEEHIKNIVKFSQGDYVFIHSSKDWLYDPNVVKLLNEEIKDNEDIIIGSCIFYKDGQYVGQTCFSKMEDEAVSSTSIAEAIRDGLPLLINRSFLQQSFNVENKIDFRTVKKRTTEIPSLCHETVPIDEIVIRENSLEEVSDTETSWLKKLFSHTTKSKIKIKVAFIVQMLELWDKQAPVYEEMSKNPLFETSIILVPAMDMFTWKLKPYADEIQFMSLRYPKANLIKAVDDEGEILKIEPNQFDYVFYQRPYDNYLPKELRTSNVYLDTKICYIPYGYQGANVFMEGNTNDEFFKNIYMSFLESEELKGVLENKFKESVETNTQKFLNLGYPVFDTYLKLKGNGRNNRKKGIMWTPRWAFDPLQGGSHFVEYKNHFVALRDKYHEKEIVIRPHPLMWENVVKEGLMSQGEVEEYRGLLQSKNILVDTNKMIEDSVKESGVLITDFSTIIITYFMTGKPIIYCPFDTELNELYQKLLAGMYVANSWDDVEKYLDMLERGEDELFEIRQEIIKKELKHLGGGTKRIVAAIIEDYNED